MATNVNRRGALRELDHRASNGIDVSLLWDERDNTVIVSVIDHRSGESFDLEASPDRALEIFHHPYAQAIREGLCSTPELLAA